jgi:3'-phosphoadenosine 5'-phosphosulfate sulfotransferase (PAPS reductase)/FAD synthetase
MKHIVSFSGGKDSTAMLLRMIETNMQIDRIICIDTTKEFPEMYEHIEKVQEYIKPLEIESIKIDFDYWFYEHIKTKGKNKGRKGYSWPDFRNRWCTALKSESFQRTSYGDGNYNPRQRGRTKRINKNIVEYHGIALDEKNRSENNKDGRVIRYPLIDWKMTEQDNLEYCYSKGFDWDGLYEKMSRVSCYCCPLSRIGELKIVHKEYPELWKKMKKLDNKSYRKFRSDYSLTQLEDKFKYCIY